MLFNKEFANYLYNDWHPRSAAIVTLSPCMNVPHEEESGG